MMVNRLERGGREGVIGVRKERWGTVNLGRKKI